MVLCNTLYGKKEEKLLIAGTVLTDGYIKSIKNLKISGLYIDDDISKDIEIHNNISDTLRAETVKSVKNMFIEAESEKILPNKLTSIKHQLESIIDELIDNKNMMINMIDLKVFDNYTYSHSVNVAVISLIIGMAMNLGRSELEKLGLGALMHDIGKVFIDKNIVGKPANLTDEEFEEMKTHSSRGYDYVKKHSQIPNKSYLAVLDHHEKFDGTGYPGGKAGDNISLYGRIISLADVYDAMTSERIYRKAMLPSEAMEYILGNGGQHFDPKLVSIFSQKVAPYPIGTFVKLSNEARGLVIENFETCCLRPRIKVVYEYNERIDPYVINLKDDLKLLNVTITGISDE